MVLDRRCMFVIFMAVVLLGLSLISANAAEFEKEIITPKFSYINSFYNDFEISDSGNVSVSSYLNVDNSNQVKITGYLQQFNDGSWKTVKSWSNTSSGNDVVLKKEWTVASGYTYRYVSYGFVYVGGSMVESTRNESSKIYY